jgi:hypothetical protein
VSFVGNERYLGEAATTQVSLAPGQGVVRPRGPHEVAAKRAAARHVYTGSRSASTTNIPPSLSRPPAEALGGARASAPLREVHGGVLHLSAASNLSCRLVRP